MNNKGDNLTETSKDMPEEAFNFWFSDNNHIRSPFPSYIQDELRVKTSEQFNAWIDNISEKAGKELNDSIIAEKFEEILFETAAGLVKTYDETLTILYPFMPRVGDVINDKKLSGDAGESIIIDRTHIKRGDHAFLKVKCKPANGSSEWYTEFELPE